MKVASLNQIDRSTLANHVELLGERIEKIKSLLNSDVTSETARVNLEAIAQISLTIGEICQAIEKTIEVKKLT
jgi:hypothetical protein